MAKLVLKLPALPDPDAFDDASRDLSDEARLIQSLRGFACGVSLLIPAYHFLLAAETVHPDAKDADDYPRLVTTYFMKETMLDTVLLHLRRLFEDDPRSLAVGTIVRLLSDEVHHEALRRESKRSLGPAAIDDHEFDVRVQLLVLQCAMHVTPLKHPLLHRVFQQVRLVRRAANKRAAHITLDDYNIGLDDIHQLVCNAVRIAQAIQRILGSSVSDIDYSEVDAASYEASRRIFGCSHAGGSVLVTDGPPMPKDVSTVEPLVEARVSILEAARMCGLAPSTIRRMARAGELHAQKVGGRWLIERASVMARLCSKPHGRGCGAPRHE